MITRALWLSGMLLAMVTYVAQAGDCCQGSCSRCGGCAPTRKICRVVEETKKVPKTKYSCECEDFCIPGASELCGYTRECDECGNVKCKKNWKPTCGEVASKNVLKKRIVEKEEKTYKWVVEEVCASCACGGGACPGACGSCVDGNACATNQGAAAPIEAAASVESPANEVPAIEPPAAVEPAKTKTVSFLRGLRAGRSSTKK